MNIYDVIVIGAGQAGLAMSYYLQQEGLSFLVLDQHQQVGESWRRRYDSLVLFTPRTYSGLPGLPFPGNQDELPTKDDVAHYLQLYAAYFQFPIRHQQTVISVTLQRGTYLVKTDAADSYLAKQIVVATGPFHRPLVPSWSKRLASSINQLHTNEFRNSAQLVDGPVLIVGAGNSGAQLAVELAAERHVYLAFGQNRAHFPLILWGKNLFWYLDKLGFSNITINSRLGRWLAAKPDPIFGYKEEIKQLIAQNRMTIKPRARSANHDSVHFTDGSQLSVPNILWATGYQPDYTWLDVPGVRNPDGKPIHDRGVTPLPGLYFLGLPWQYRRSSALLGGVGADAAYLSEQIRHHSSS
ncbi:flavin-containing monooxygenase [Brevibacillus migulae]|uniref:flavin-containing monooxygenase n=1 Tax=Brevibacillus migulae TaxID=1644114 RepID=UPI00106E67B2|nr:NAD(P)/FAD-dependent oxidoreductase [Brevibacillus migulae]